MCTNVYQNRLCFVEDMSKTFWCVFSVHSVEILSDNQQHLAVSVATTTAAFLQRREIKKGKVGKFWLTSRLAPIFHMLKCIGTRDI